MEIDPYCQRRNCSPLLNALSIGYVDIAGRSPAMGRQQLEGWGVRQTHSPGGATAAEFFVGVIFRVLIRKKNKYNYSN